MRHYVSTIPINLVLGDDPAPIGATLTGPDDPASDHEVTDLSARDVRDLLASGAIVPAGGETAFATGAIIAGDLLSSDPVTVIVNGRTLGTYADLAEALRAAVAEAERLDGEVQSAELERDQAIESVSRLGDDVAALREQLAEAVRVHADLDKAEDATTSDPDIAAKAEDAKPAKPAKGAK